jgi:hypothetical protein
VLVWFERAAVDECQLRDAHLEGPQFAGRMCDQEAASKEQEGGHELAHTAVHSPDIDGSQYEPVALPCRMNGRNAGLARAAVIQRLSDSVMVYAYDCTQPLTQKETARRNRRAVLLLHAHPNGFARESDHETLAVRACLDGFVEHCQIQRLTEVIATAFLAAGFPAVLIDIRIAPLGVDDDTSRSIGLRLSC